MEKEEQSWKTYTSILILSIKLFLLRQCDIDVDIAKQINGTEQTVQI